MSNYHTCSTCVSFNAAESVCTHAGQCLMVRKVTPDWGRQCQLYSEKPVVNDDAAMLETLQRIHRKVLAAWPIAPWLQMEHRETLMRPGDATALYPQGARALTAPCVIADLQEASVTCGDLLTPGAERVNYEAYAVERMVYGLEGQIRRLSSAFQKGKALRGSYPGRWFSVNGTWTNRPLNENLDKLQAENPNSNVVVVLSKESWANLGLDDDADGVGGYKMRNLNTFLYRSPIWSGSPDINYAFVAGSLRFATHYQANALPPQRTVNYSAHGLGLQLIQQRDSYLLRTLCGVALTDPHKAIAF